MGTGRIVLLSSRSLLSAGVQSLLQKADSLELCIVPAEDPQAIARIRELSPRVIVLDSDDSSLGQGVITRMLEENPRARVIALNLKRRGIEVYRMKRLVRTDLDGLMGAILGKAQQPRVS